MLLTALAHSAAQPCVLLLMGVHFCVVHAVTTHGSFAQLHGHIRKKLSMPHQINPVSESLNFFATH